MALTLEHRQLIPQTSLDGGACPYRVGDRCHTQVCGAIKPLVGPARQRPDSKRHRDFVHPANVAGNPPRPGTTLGSRVVVTAGWRVARLPAVREGEWGPEFYANVTRRALAGDQNAWNELCGALKGVAWKVIMGFGLRDGSADDAMAGALFQLARYLRNVREPEKLPGWFAKTTRRVCLDLVKVQGRIVPASPDLERHEAVVYDDASIDMLDDELLAAAHQALNELSEQCQQLIRFLTTSPPLSYTDIAELLTMPIGSIGPTRQRCLDRLRARPALARFLVDRTER